MVLPGSSAAAASAIWLSRRGVRGVAQISQQHDYYQQPTFRPPPSSLIPPLVPLAPPVASQWSLSQSPITESISRKIREKFATNESQMNELLSELNRDVFWSQYSTLSELSQIDTKTDIMKIIKTFLFISKKSIYLFSNYSRKIIANIHLYSANDLSEIINSFAQLGFLEESFCVQTANRIVQDCVNCEPNNLVLIFDGFASTRCNMSIVNDAIVSTIGNQIDQLTVTNLSLLSSCLARLNIKHDSLFAKIESEFLIRSVKTEIPVSARDVTLTAYAFAKIRKQNTSVLFQEQLVELSKDLIRDFTAKELQMLTCAFEKWSIDKSVFTDISGQAQRRIAQFSADTLIHLLRSFANLAVLDDGLVTRVVCQFPRLSHTLKPAEIVAFWNVFKDAKINSPIVIETLRPLTVMRAGTYSVTDWVSLFESVSTIGNREVCREILDSFILISELPAKYKGALTPVSSTVLEKMRPEQVCAIIKSVEKMKIHVGDFVSLILGNLECKVLSPPDASDVYCALVALNAHETHPREMVKLMSRALDV